VFAAIASAWQRASAREQRLLAAAATVIALAILYAWVWNPMTADIERLSRDLPRAQSVLDAARAQAENLVALERNSAPLRGQDALASVERVLAERGLRNAVTALDLAEGRVRLTFAAVRFDALPGFLDALTRNAGVRVLEATLTPRVEPGTVRAEFSLAR
jgi:type II secretory pathway component PulM